ncbi:phosphopentomutase [Mangrovicoccus algicola]|uniref:Phosphopentomutase n=1 Tax=Mangrovicoccus algicola TaxID=2771008 RepID=A0A8J7CIQ1_9RHOB|nr:phosphopentomutase [Mangrovicoccus algicola]MBE3639870.1 phosphopentomutase [Mangrovicoccus algicola]
MSRAFLVVLDSAGIGGAPDAEAFGDAGADTLGHIAAACAAQRAEEGRSGPLELPNLARLGLARAMQLATGSDPAGTAHWPAPDRGAFWAAASERSRGKDTPSGHWELAGLPVPFDWTFYPDADPAFPPEDLALVREIAGVEGTLCNTHGSGTDVLARHGAAHMRSGWPICYTSADSVFQIAAHEDSFGLDRLLDLCERLAPHLHRKRVGRVIARPFLGSPETGFARTGNRRDYAVPPPEPTLCNRVQAAGREVRAIGKIRDIFAGSGITSVKKGADAELMEHLLDDLRDAPDGSLTFANFVEFDSLWGHRRDVAGYARALEWFDAQVPRLLAALRPGDLILFTADHGNDPTWPGTDHTRERVPVLGRGLVPGGKGHCAFVDVAATVACHLGLDDTGPGTPLT